MQPPTVLIRRVQSAFAAFGRVALPFLLALPSCTSVVGPPPTGERADALESHIGVRPVPLEPMRDARITMPPFVLNDANGVDDNVEAETQATGCDAEPREVLTALGLPDMVLRFPASDLDEQSAFADDGSICLQDAISSAIDSLLWDSSDLESPLALMLDIIDDESAARAALQDFLNRASTLFALVPLSPQRGSGVFPPEHGESIEANWVFFVAIGDFSDHLFWVVVPRDGGDVLNYGFN